MPPKSFKDTTFREILDNAVNEGNMTTGKTIYNTTEQHILEAMAESIRKTSEAVKEMYWRKRGELVNNCYNSTDNQHADIAIEHELYNAMDYTNKAMRALNLVAISIRSANK